MSDAGPNFRVAVRFDGVDGEDATVTTLRDFLESNEAVPEVCERVKRLQPGEVAHFGGGMDGASPGVSVRRIAVSPPRFTRVRVPINFDGAEYATVTIDRKRLTLSIRPARQRTVFEMELGDFAERMLDRQAKRNVAARRKARRSRR
jgi:hypothetical protein